MAAITSNEDRIRIEFSTLVDNFTNLIRASKVQDPARDQGTVPGEMMEVFAEKMLAACQALLSITSELKRTTLLNDIETRNMEVRETIKQYQTQQYVGNELDDAPAPLAPENSDINIM